jgi:hypothetical protein
MTDKLSAELLIKEHFALSDKLKDANKKFAEYCAPAKARLEEIDAQLLQLLNSLTTGDKKSISTDIGTAYVSNIMNVGVDPEAEPYVNVDGDSQVGRMALFDWAVEHWGVTMDGWDGSEMLLVQPQKDAVKAYIEAHGKPPPGLKISYFARVNVRRS